MVTRASILPPETQIVRDTKVLLPCLIITFILSVRCDVIGEVDGLIRGKRVAVVLPAYNAAKTLEATVRELPRIVDDCILVDDHSTDETVELARGLNLTVVVHEKNRGYGANQKTCYRKALDSGADVVVMVHPDYQYSPRLVIGAHSGFRARSARGSTTAACAGPPVVKCGSSTEFGAAGPFPGAAGANAASGILGGGALQGGMPFYKYVANRVLTGFQNYMTGSRLSEYHTGFRAFSRELLLALPLEKNSDDFVFDNQVLAQAIFLGARIGEISCPTRYFPEASSINFRRSTLYGLGVLKTSIGFRLARWGFTHPAMLRLPQQRLHISQDPQAISEL